MGQFGSLYDQMNWTTRNHNAYAALNFEISKRWSIYENFVWSRGRGSMSGIELNTAGISQIPDGFNYAAISELGRFSALSADRTQSIAGVNFQISERWGLHAAHFYGRFQDRLPYLLDGTGRTQGVEAGLSYTF